MESTRDSVRKLKLLISTVITASEEGSQFNPREEVAREVLTLQWRLA